MGGIAESFQRLLSSREYLKKSLEHPEKRGFRECLLKLEG